MNDIRQMKTVVFGFLAVAAAAAALPASAENPVAGVVVAVEGRPQVQIAGKEDFKRVKMNQLIHDGDTLKTEKGDRVGVAFVGGAEMRINENSVFVVQSGGGTKPTTVYTSLGDAWTRLISGHNGIQVRSPVAVAAVRGTEADIDVSDRMGVKVYEGLVDVMNDKGKTSLQAGQQTSVSGAGSAPAPARAMSPQDYKTWQNKISPANLDKSLGLLNQAAVRNRTLELEMKNKDGSQKKIKLNFEKK